MNERERLSSRLGFILLSAGCAIGCGNVWKFPWMAGQYGGGGFVLVYVLCLLLLGAAIGGGALSASAAGTAHMRISSSQATLYRGDVFTLTVSLTNENAVSNGGELLLGFGEVYA